ncbi:MAG: hypothetical protein IPP66_06915 [Anaerolineales bacterium]|nr:hypothetical protein [Anaerolineales bacterium]
MNYLNKALQVFQREGLAGVTKRIQFKLGKKNITEIQSEDMEIIREKQIYQEQIDTLNHYIANINFPGIQDFYWYHAVELENGIVTPGDYDYRNSLDGFHFPENMTGMKVLDVGSATGFFAFEFEKRGATVTSVELPSLVEWDMIHNEKENILANMMHFHHTAIPKEAFYRHLDGPFEFCQARKNTSVKRIFSSIYNLRSQLKDDESFDIVFLGDILLHLFSPFMALNVIAPLCKSKLIVATDLFATKAEVPLMEFLGTRSKGKDSRTWWMFNDKCIEEMLFRVGFSNVKLAGEYSGIMRRTWSRYHRYVFHATK